jgi:hypothetical protein
MEVWGTHGRDKSGPYGGRRKRGPYGVPFMGSGHILVAGGEVDGVLFFEDSRDLVGDVRGHVIPGE